MCRNAQFFEMYLTSLPDHSQPGFDEKRHFSRFKQHNMVFNAFSRQSNCDRHVGCLSLKSVLSGEEWYGIGSHRLAVRPGKFLILNDDQEYSIRIDGGEGAHVLSVFFKREFAAAVFSDILCGDEAMTADPSVVCGSSPEFFQTLNELDPGLERKAAEDRPDQESDEEIDDGPACAADDVKKLERPELVGRDRRDQGDTRYGGEDQADPRNDLKLGDLERRSGRDGLAKLKWGYGYIGHGRILTVAIDRA